MRARVALECALAKSARSRASDCSRGNNWPTACITVSARRARRNREDDGAARATGKRGEGVRDIAAVIVDQTVHRDDVIEMPERRDPACRRPQT